MDTLFTTEQFQNGLTPCRSVTCDMQGKKADS